MNPPPPPPELQDLEDGTGRSSPPCCWSIHIRDVVRRIQERLCRTGGHDHPALVDPASFQRRLAHHLQRLPPRYLAEIDSEGKAEDVLLHLRILDECVDPDKRPVFHARYVKSITVGADYNGGDGEELDQPCQRLMKGIGLETNVVDGNDSRITSSRVIPLHEIIFCSLDRRNLLCRVSTLLDEVGLHIREVHLYCTIDGFCLALFLVDGWETEETNRLIAEINLELALKNKCLIDNKNWRF